MTIPRRVFLSAESLPSRGEIFLQWEFSTEGEFSF
jgi:hypothetical protein